LRTGLEKAGMRLADPDLRSAAIVVARGLTLITGNLRHFSRVPGIDAEDWISG
jgi:tRNA(fMet)-specific endonuclease VapC